MQTLKIASMLLLVQIAFAGVESDPKRVFDSNNPTPQTTPQSDISKQSRLTRTCKTFKDGRVVCTEKKAKKSLLMGTPEARTN